MDILLDDDDKSNQDLITAVRCNRFLFDKNEKLYSNTNFKTNTWTRIGAGLTNPIEGHVAEKKFYYLRQRYGKERRKVLRSITKSGGGTDLPTYNPTWVLYNDLTFLEGFIKPRKRTSKFKVPTNNRAHSASSTLPSTSFSDKFAVTTTDLSKSFTGTDENLNTCFTSVPATSSFKIAQVRNILPKISSIKLLPVNQEQKDTGNVILKELSEKLSSLAAKIGQVIDRSPAVPSNTSTVSNTSSGIQPMLNAIEFALRVVPEQSQLQCLIDILQYINNFNNISDNTIDSEGSH